MTKIQKVIIFGNYFGLGIMNPILSLFLLSHGCNLATLAIVMGIYSITVIIAEIPSGIFANIYGRKISYLFYGICTCISFIMMYFSCNLIVLASAMMFLGLGNAFASGSLDSIIIEDFIQREGQEKLNKVTSVIAICQSGGISIGAFLGGIIPNVSGYVIHIILRISILMIVGFLSIVFLKETLQEHKVRRTLTGHIKDSISILKRTSNLRVLLFCISGSSVMLFAIETYWQPEFTALCDGELNFLLGIICSLGYCSTMIGSYFMGKISMITSKIKWKYYLLLITAMSFSLITLALQGGAIGFIGCYISSMFILGAISIPEQTLMNIMVTNETRASLLSVASLFSKFGGVCSSTICAGLIVYVGISGVWLIAAAIAIITIIIATIKLRGTVK